jgi:pSer/pThr/pTyr-binding forkhead associated (FHA) protein
MGPVGVELVEGANQKTGRFKLEGRMVEAATIAGAGSIVLPTGDRIILGEETLTIGRLPSCDIPVPDPNVSRKHAEIRPSGAGYVVVDLGSTNGTRVNGATVNERKLTDGDVIAVGTTRLRFEAS